MTQDLNWLAFSKRATWSTDLAQAFAALGLSVSPDGAPRRFAGPDFTVEVVIDQGGAAGFLCWRGPAGQGVSLMVATGAEVIEFLSPIPAHGESGRALRQWLEWWGWKPPARRAAGEAPAPMVI
jgi:hypothetical protein